MRVLSNGPTSGYSNAIDVSAFTGLSSQTAPYTKFKARRTLDDPLASTNKCGGRATALARIGMLIEVAIEERGLDGDQPHDLPAGGTSRRLLRRRNAL